MVLTCVHDLQPKRLIQMVTGELIRCYPLSMARVDGKPMPVRHAIISDCSGWIRVKLWGQDALDALIGHFIEIRNVWCYQNDGRLWLCVGRQSSLRFRTQP